MQARGRLKTAERVNPTNYLSGHPTEIDELSNVRQYNNCDQSTELEFFSDEYG